VILLIVGAAMPFGQLLAGRTDWRATGAAELE
jgi:hypothetical protein